MFLNVEQLEKQLDKEDFQEIGSMAAFNVPKTQFQMFITSRIYLNDEYVATTRSYFQQYTQLEIPEFRKQSQFIKEKSNEAKVKHDMDVNQAINIELEYKVAKLLKKRFNERKLQIQGCTFQEVKALDAILEDNAKKRCMMFITSRLYLDDEYVAMTRIYFIQYTQQAIPELHDTLIQHLESVKKSIDKRAQHKREYDCWVNERQIQITEEKVDTSKALDASLVDKESSGTKSKEQDTCSRSGNNIHADDADIRPIYDEEPMTEVQTTTEINVFAIRQQHTEQPEFNNKGEVDQNAKECHDTCHLPAILTDNQTLEHSYQTLESENICLKKTVAQFQKDFSRMETHCVNLELKYQNKVLKAGQQSQFLKEKNSEPSLMPSARSQSTANGSKPKPRINNQNSRNWLASKSSFATTKTVPIAKHPRNSLNDSCVTKFLKEVNSHAKVPSNKTTNKNKPIKQISVAKKPERQIPKGHRFSIKKTFVVHEKTMTPRSCLLWKSTGRIFKTIGLRWIPTGKIFASSTTKVDSEPLNGSDADITNQYECEQTLDVSACTLNLSACTSLNPKEEELRVWLLKRQISHKPRLQGIFI
nr:hypothetical protein [Tanacetum cinerariifolium]